jgi:hypothetical protein
MRLAGIASEIGIDFQKAIYCPTHLTQVPDFQEVVPYIRTSMLQNKSSADDVRIFSKAKEIIIDLARLFETPYFHSSIQLLTEYLRKELRYFGEDTGDRMLEHLRQHGITNGLVEKMRVDLLSIDTHSH